MSDLNAVHSILSGVIGGEIVDSTRETLLKRPLSDSRASTAIDVTKRFDCAAKVAPPFLDRTLAADDLEITFSRPIYYTYVVFAS